MKEIHFDVIDSTNTYAKNNNKELKDLTFISASYQTNGHGRINRNWISNKNENLMFSLLIKDKKIISNYRSLSIISGVAISKALEKIKLSNVMIKWPNDVYVNDKKIAGILLESKSNDTNLDCLVIGIGINVNQKEYSNDINATSIYLESNMIIDIYKIKKIVYKYLIKEIKHMNNKKYLKFVNDHNYLFNKDAYAIINNEKKLVKILEVNEDNTLKVLDNGKIHNLYTDEISFHC